MFPRPSGIVTVTTDFGSRDPYAGILAGALLKASSKPRLVHVSHEVPAQDVATGAFMMWSLVDRFPAGTVHVGVVDPGVGTERALLAACAHGQYWLVPDNGLIGAVLAAAPGAPAACEVRRLDLDHLKIRRESRTFDGRDVLAPVAAWLASGRYGFSAMGPIVTDLDRTDHVFGSGEPRIVHVDHYGNLISNVRAAEVAAAAAGSVQVGDRRLPIHGAYGDVEAGESLAYVGSFGLLEIAARNGSAAADLGLQRGAAIRLVNP